MPADAVDSMQESRPDMEGFVQIHPSVCFNARCPFTATSATAVDWAVTGQWTMAKLRYEKTGREFWSDPPWGVGLLAPCWIDPESGEVLRVGGPRWYADATRHAWRHRSTEDVSVGVEVRRVARHVCLVNCLKPHFRDAVSLLFRLALLRDRGLDIVVLITANLRWLVPDYVAEVWTVTSGHPQATEWNDLLAEKVKRLVQARETCVVPATFHPALAYHTDFARLITTAETEDIRGHLAERLSLLETLRAAPITSFTGP